MHPPHEPQQALRTSLGYTSVRGFLWWIVVLFVVLLGVTAYLSWHFAMDISVRSHGTIRPFAHYQIKAAFEGIIGEVLVREGDRVKAGARLAVLQDTQWQLQLDELMRELAAISLRVDEVNVEVDEQRLLRLADQRRALAALQRAKLGFAQVRVEQQLSSTALLASYGWKRKPLRELWPVRQARAAVAQRQAEWATARQQLQLVTAPLRELESLDMAYRHLLQNKALLEKQLSLAVICAPEDGVVLTRDIGKRLGDHIAAGEVLLEMAGEGGWLAEVTVAELDMPKVEIGQRTRVYFEAYPHLQYQIFDGTVQSVATQKVPAVGYAIGVKLYDPDLAADSYRLAVGMKVEVRIVVERGRIAQLAWLRLMRSVGKVHKGDLYAATD